MVFLSFSKVDNLVFVTGNHLEKIPLLKGLLSKIGAIVVDNCGGGTAKEDLMAGAQKAVDEGARILIYPEGHLSAPGTHHRYRYGIWNMYNTYKIPVIPAATNLGEFWRQSDLHKKPGIAVLEFLEPIMPGLNRDDFMKLLEKRIEDTTIGLRCEVTGCSDLKASELVDFKEKKTNVA